ncbi:hypothetical protein BT69DRAFT_1333467 [Atractiella rhizophila]|nr:hypothetical protein BT69DRAFT_1333467 [Atractiella rhizophila]
MRPAPTRQQLLPYQEQSLNQIFHSPSYHQVQQQAIQRQRALEQQQRQQFRQQLRLERQREKEKERQRAENQHHHHRVYVLTCAHCDSFISDRGMRAVLLLKPDISLFSTDSTPFNASPLPPLDPNSCYIASCIPSERTCDCLTQSLGCHQCGATLGYHIITACEKCTNSLSNERTVTNGHRWVFHWNEVNARERRYVEGEAGIKRLRAPEMVRETPNPELIHGDWNVSSESQLLQLDISNLKRKQSGGRWSISSDDSMAYDVEQPELSPIQSSPPTLVPVTPSLTSETSSILSLPLTPNSQSPLSTPSSASHFSRNSYFLPQLTSIRRPPSVQNGSYRDNEGHQRQNSNVALKEGDVVYWHHLLQEGERTLPSEISRARMISGGERLGR